ncbi:MAG: thiamine-phosphate kinase [Candidatus Omnitrophica bacterium]|nr:thiamine-phosphate kinase [Candidatus Omnitrophota bacterium]
MRISDIGEFGLIKRFRKSIKLDSSVIKGSGDDCAVIKWDKKNYLLYTCDMIVEEVDFKAKEDPYLIGRKALAVSISDIAACAGVARYAVVSMGFPKSTSVAKIDQITRGIFDLAKKFKVNIVGGDLSCADKLIIDVSMLGVVEKNNLILRSGAKLGDIVFVTGKLGGSIKGKHLRFMPRIKEARYLARHYKINSMIDISDGFIQDLGHICEESRMGAIVFEKQIPVNKDAGSIKDALFMGEDFELIFTMPRKEAVRLLKMKIKGFFLFVEIVDKKYGIKFKDNSEIDLSKNSGFRHF